MENPKKAQLYSAEAPNDEQRERFERFLTKKYDQPVALEWIRDESLRSGFRLNLAGEVYNWTPEGRLQQLRDKVDEINRKKLGRKNQTKNLISLIKSSLDSWTLEATPTEEGHVVSVGDGIVIATGLESVVYGEVVLFESGVRGMVQELRQGEIGIILFGDEFLQLAASFVHDLAQTGTLFLGHSAHAAQDAGELALLAQDLHPDIVQFLQAAGSLLDSLRGLGLQCLDSFFHHQTSYNLRDNFSSNRKAPPLNADSKRGAKLQTSRYHPDLSLNGSNAALRPALTEGLRSELSASCTIPLPVAAGLPVDAGSTYSSPSSSRCYQV